MKRSNKRKDMTIALYLSGQSTMEIVIHTHWLWPALRVLGQVTSQCGRLWDYALNIRQGSTTYPMTINITIFANTLKTLPRVLGHHHQPHLSIIIIIIIYYKLLMIFKSAATGLAPEFLGTINNLTTSQVPLHNIIKAKICIVLIYKSSLIVFVDLSKGPLGSNKTLCWVKTSSILTFVRSFFAPS